MGPLDKQVDIYCAMIDDAEAANSKKQSDEMGLVSHRDENGQADDDEDDDGYGAAAE